jgi:hypothetical protein
MRNLAITNSNHRVIYHDISSAARTFLSESVSTIEPISRPRNNLCICIRPGVALSNYEVRVGVVGLRHQHLGNNSDESRPEVRVRHRRW